MATNTTAAITRRLRTYLPAPIRLSTRRAGDTITVTAAACPTTRNSLAAARFAQLISETTGQQWQLEHTRQLRTNIQMVYRLADHTRDEHCTVDPDTGCCTGCGAEHGPACPTCGGSGYHTGVCADITRMHIEAAQWEGQAELYYSSGDVAAAECAERNAQGLRWQANRMTYPW